MTYQYQGQLYTDLGELICTFGPVLGTIRGRGWNTDTDGNSYVDPTARTTNQYTTHDGRVWTNSGALYVTSAAPTGNGDYIHKGFRYRADGAMYVKNGPTAVGDVMSDGWRVSAQGQAYIAGPSFYLPLADLGAGAVDTTPLFSTGSATPAFTRATTAWTKLPTGLWASVASGTARSFYIGLDTTVGAYAGYLSEHQRTNSCLQARDLTNASWTKTTATAAKDQAGIDGVANSASSLLATAGNGQATQAIVLASAVKVWGVWLKRLVGTGTIQISLDNFATNTDVTASVNSSTYTLVFMTQTLLNPTVGIRLVTSGDKVAVDMCQLEDSPVGPAAPSTPIPTTTVAVTRNGDADIYTLTGNADSTVGTCYAEVSLLNSGGGGGLGIITFQNDLDTPNLANSGDTGILIKDGVAGNTATKSGLTALSTGVRKRASSWGPAGLAVTGDGAAPATNATFDGSMGVNQIGIGSDNNHQIDGTIKNVRIWKTQLSNAQLQAITA